MFVGIKMVAMVGKSTIKNGKVVLRQLNQSQGFCCSQLWALCRLHCLLIDYCEINTYAVFVEAKILYLTNATKIYINIYREE